MEKPPTRDGLICKPVASASERINFVSMKRIDLVLTQMSLALASFGQ